MLLRLACVAFVGCCLGDTAAAAADTRAAVLTVHVEIHPQTRLRTSSSVLRFEVLPNPPVSVRPAVARGRTWSNKPAADLAPSAQVVSVTATIEFSAAVRTRRDADVVLTVESAGTLEGPDGAADVESQISFGGDLEGTLPGVMGRDGPQVAARWIGGGVRDGRLTFTLRGPINPGTYTLPLRFVLSTQWRTAGAHRGRKGASGGAGAGT